MDAMTEKVSFRCFVKMQLHFILFGLLHYIDKSSHVNCFVKKNSYLSCLYVIALSEPKRITQSEYRKKEEKKKNYSNSTNCYGDILIIIFPSFRCILDYNV